MLKARLRSEAGFSVVEGAVAGLILVIGLLGGVGVFDSARRESNTGERIQIAQAKAEAELERMRDVAYPDLATDPSEAWIGSGSEGDPTDRVVPGSPPAFRVSETSNEELAQAEAGAGIRPYSAPAPVVIGGAQYEMSIYRFVSWRDVECQIADVSPLVGPWQSLLQDLIDQIDAATGPSSQLNRLLVLAGAILPSPIRALLSSTLTPTLTEIRAKLDGLLGAVNSLNEIDPCDADLDSLNEISDTLDLLGPSLDAVDEALANYYGGSCVRVAGVVISCPGSGSGATTLQDQVNALAGADYPQQLDELIDSVGDISSADHPYNTKRVTVAVVMKPVSGSGPFKPVWATSVVSDPEAGVLGG